MHLHFRYDICSALLVDLVKTSVLNPINPIVLLGVVIQEVIFRIVVLDLHFLSPLLLPRLRSLKACLQEWALGMAYLLHPRLLLLLLWLVMVHLHLDLHLDLHSTRRLVVPIVR